MASFSAPGAVCDSSGTHATACGLGETPMPSPRFGFGFGLVIDVGDGLDGSTTCAGLLGLVEAFFLFLGLPGGRWPPNRPDIVAFSWIRLTETAVQITMVGPRTSSFCVLFWMLEVSRLVECPFGASVDLTIC